MEKIAEILFENTDKIPEGLYLELMNNLKKPSNTDQTRFMQNIDSYICGYKDATGRFPPKEKVVGFLMDNYSGSDDSHANVSLLVDLVWTFRELPEPVHDDTFEIIIKGRIKDIIKIAFYTTFFAILI